VKKFHPALLAFFSGFLLYAAWPVSPFSFLIFIALIPLLWLEQQGISRSKFFGAVYLAMLTWNAATTWWIWNSTDVGAVSAILANSLLMSIPWMGFYNVKKRLGEKWGYIALICFWLCFEYIHLNWELTWPWLTLGNVFATHPNWVQWYELTGSSGGSLWVLVINVLLFYAIRKYLTRNQDRKFLSMTLAILFVPFIISYLLLLFQPKYEKENVSESPNIVVIQPNVDPYQKFEAGSQQMQLQKLINISEKQIDANTKLLVWPETALNLPSGIWEDSLRKNYFFSPLWSFLGRHPGLELYTGLEGYNIYQENNKTKYSRHIPGGDDYYDSYNSAFIMNANGPLISYHKSKLVPGVEALPSFLKFMDKYFEQFGGTTGGYARQDERTVLVAGNSGYKIAPAICYESIYGEFLTNYVKKGANIIGIITNDGWWGNTPGHKQHLNYARLRAIETRRWVLRSANTGISCFIDPNGRIIDPQGWDKEASIKLAVPVQANERLTFFVRTGDVISKIAAAATIILLIWSITVLVRKKFAKAVKTV